jgi:hypothetical protein
VASLFVVFAPKAMAIEGDLPLATSIGIEMPVFENCNRVSFDMKQGFTPTSGYLVVGEQRHKLPVQLKIGRGEGMNFLPGYSDSLTVYFPPNGYQGIDYANLKWVEHGIYSDLVLVADGKELMYGYYAPYKVDTSKDGVFPMGYVKPADQWSDPCANFPLSEYKQWFPVSTVATIAFSDVPVTHTYAKEIEYMKVNGISAGFNNGTEYRPNTTIDRKSLVTLVVKAKYSENEINNCIAANGYTGKNIFHDVPSTHHFAPFICMAKVNQIAIGYSTGYFGVDEPIKADAAIKIVMRTLDKNLEIAMNAPLSEYTKRLNDLGYYPPTVSKSNEQRHETTRGEFAYITQIINDSYKRLGGTNVK